MVTNGTNTEGVDTSSSSIVNEESIEMKQQKQCEEPVVAVKMPSIRKPRSSDYENLGQFNNLNDNDDEGVSRDEEINAKNIEIYSISSPSSVVMSEENNNSTDKVVIELVPDKPIHDDDDELDGYRSTSKMTSGSDDSSSRTSTIEIPQEQQQQVNHGTSQANSKFCLINDDNDELQMKKKNNNQIFSPKTSVFLKNKNTESVFDVKAATINKLLLCITIISICLFSASVCYIVIAHLTSTNFNLPGLFKSEAFFIPIDENINHTTLTTSSITIKASSVEVSTFGNLKNGEEVKKYVLRNQNGFEVALISFGATIQSIKTKDRNGKLLNVVLNLNNIEEYANPENNPHFGGIIGRTSNRISNSEFTLNGVKYTLDQNNGVNSLHGGKSGFDRRNWKSTVDGDAVKFSFSSPDSEGGYPGDVNIEVTYSVDKQHDILRIDYKGTTNKATPLDLTNHAYFNLNGHDSGLPVYSHEAKIFADNYLVSNPVDLITTGEIRSVENTKYDLREYTKLGDRIKENVAWPEEGYDNYFVVNQQSGRKYAASVRNPANGLVLDIFSDQNGIQFYTGNFLNVSVPGLKFKMHDAFCLESHNFPDAVNKKLFPSSIVRPEGEYTQKTEWRFRIEH